MRLIALSALAIAALGGCNSTDRANVRNAIVNTSDAVGQGVERGAEKVENFARDAGHAIENGASDTRNSLRSDNSANSSTNTAGKKTDK